MEDRVTPEWEIRKKDFLKRLGCTEASFESEMSLPDLENVKRIVPLRFLREIESIVPMSFSMLRCLLLRVRRICKPTFRPFHGARFQFCKVDPRYLKIGQRFVYRENYQELLEKLPTLFSKFAIAAGIVDLGAYFIFGTDMDGGPALACYLPPLIEKHDSDLVIMDGIHRNFIVKQIGTTINAVIIENVGLPFPCDVQPWSKIQIIGLSEKPAEARDRYFGLTPTWFRDLKYLGIDG